MKNTRKPPTSPAYLAISAGVCAFFAAVSVFAQGSAHAAGMKASVQAVPAQRAHGQSLINHGDFCGPFDPDCRKFLRTFLNDIHFTPIQVQGGLTVGPEGVNGGAGAVRFKTISVDKQSGDLSALMFDATYLSESSVRLRFTLADTEVLYLCKTPKGEVKPPVLSLLVDECVPGGAFAYVGAGAKLVEIQWDVATQRVAARWAEIHAVINLLGNASQESFLQQRLQAYAGASVDTIWHGSTPGAPEAGSASFMRGNFGISGMIRSENNHWEIRGIAGFRPNFFDWSDYSLEVRTQALYHILVAPTTMVDIGLDAQYQYNTVPSHSIGQFVSDREKHSAYLGTVLGFTFQ